MKRKKKPEEPKAGAPAFIVTFSDMITLLLTFFVMLLSMAKTQTDTTKFMHGQNSFRTAVANLGLPGRLRNIPAGAEMPFTKDKQP